MIRKVFWKLCLTDMQNNDYEYFFVIIGYYIKWFHKNKIFMKSFNDFISVEIKLLTFITWFIGNSKFKYKNFFRILFRFKVTFYLTKERKTSWMRFSQENQPNQNFQGYCYILNLTGLNIKWKLNLLSMRYSTDKIFIWKTLENKSKIHNIFFGEFIF